MMMTDAENAMLIAEMQRFVLVEQERRNQQKADHPLACFLWIALFVAALVLITYFQVWPIVGLIFGGLALVGILIGSIRDEWRKRKRLWEGCLLHGCPLVKITVWRPILLMEKSRPDMLLLSVVQKLCPNTYSRWGGNHGTCMEPFENSEAKVEYICPRCEEVLHVILENWSRVR
ncbi:hypothetical protein [Armatimonas sp.]|uniref:hypothetical protein n=1 Tax=Armatimonas sp. TaxID=1872638 RepID=UPI00286B6999|nr:hypothetical protein [Armatimonas sp.]